ncbi:MAG: tRNA lysidine(34) synthetase TilS, partial [Armatimonadetes bacterium]|nr:tRNA lysidine(34) synthetase TilS [Armatimonadota bacterium]
MLGGLTPDTVVLAAVSGGADSMALLGMLDEARQSSGFTLEVGHLDHGIPEARSAEAAAAVREEARRRGLSCRMARADVPALMRRWGVGIEVAGRRVRYAWFKRMATARPGLLIATAHTADDQAETVLLRMLRGAGLRGLSGIRPRLDLPGGGAVVRPLLTTRRAVTRAWCEREDLPVVEDPTNADTAFTRNRVRHLLLPLLEREFNPRVVEALCRLGRAAWRDERCLDAQGREAFQFLAVTEGDAVRIPDESATLDEAVRLRVWRQALGALNAEAGSADLDRLEMLLAGAAGRVALLPGGARARRTYRGVTLRNTLEEAPDLPAVPLAIPGVTEAWGRTVRISLEAPAEPTGWLGAL